MGMTNTELWARLLDHGYRPVRRAAGTALFERDGDRVIVPDDQEPVPDWIGRAIEWQLEPSLGPGWLHRPAAPANGDAAGTGTEVRAARRVVHRFVLQPAPRGRGWHAFVADEPRISVWAASRDEAETRARAATALWYDTSPDLVTLVPVGATGPAQGPAGDPVAGQAVGVGR